MTYNTTNLVNNKNTLRTAVLSMFKKKESDRINETYKKTPIAFSSISKQMIALQSQDYPLSRIKTAFTCVFCISLRVGMRKETH